MGLLLHSALLAVAVVSAAGQTTFSQDAVSVLESAGQVELTLERSDATSAEVISVSIVEQTARESSDTRK